MKNLFVSYEIAKKLKELWFDEACLGYFSNWGNQEPFLITCEYGTEKESCSIRRKNYLCSTPSYEQAIDWFFEKHDIFISPIINIETKKWSWEIFKFDKKSENEIGFNVLPEKEWEHEEKNQALTEAFEQALKLI